MNILFTKTGTPKSGSWQIRGIQIAEALGARPVLNAPLDDIRWADVIVVVKCFDERLVQRIKLAGKPIIWDALDCWPQPEGNAWSHDRAVSFLTDRIKASGAALVIAATGAMAENIGRAVPTAVIYHHALPNQEINPVREKMTAVGYQGSARYLEGWFPEIGKQCERRGWMFCINPSRLAMVDIVIAVRGGPWDGWPTRQWKSNVKLANAQATGTPFIGLPEAGARETASGAEIWLESPEDVADAFAALEPYRERQERSAHLRAAAPRLEAIAKQYREMVKRCL